MDILDNRIEYLKKKREEVLKTIKPMCEAFGIKDYDYIIREENRAEFLRLNDTKIGCSSNSIEAVVDELIGYLFITRWCKDRSLGCFNTQSKNIIKRYWV